MNKSSSVTAEKLFIVITIDFVAIPCSCWFLAWHGIPGVFSKFILLEICIVVALDPGASDGDEEEAEKGKAAKHDPAPDACASDEEHWGKEEVEVALASDSLEEFEVLHDESKVAERNYEQSSEYTKNNIGLNKLRQLHTSTP